MKVFVAGATGVLGHRTVARLVAAGAEVTGLARRSESASRLAALGARPAQVSLFDPDGLAGAVAGHELVVNLATSIPTGERAGAPGAWDENHRIRREGSRHLVDAALAAGARQYVQESIAMLYADGGDAWLDESAPVGADASGSSVLEAESNAARFADRLADQGGSGVVLRFGQLFGFDSGHTVEAIELARGGRPVELGPETAYRSSVTTDDAADAVVAVLRLAGRGEPAPSGIYNVVDDRPLHRADHVAALAAALGTPVPVPASVVPDLPSELSVLLRSQRVSNRRLADATGWRPASPSAWEGWQKVVGEWRQYAGAAAAAEGAEGAGKSG